MPWSVPWSVRQPLEQQRQPQENSGRSRHGGEHHGEAGERPKSGSSAGEGDQGQQQEQAFGVNRAKVKRGWKDAQVQHGAFGAAAVKQVQRRAVQDQQCQQETRLADEQCRQKWVGKYRLECANQDRVERKERDV